MNRELRIAEKMALCYETAKGIMKDTLKEKLDPFKLTIELYQHKFQIDVLPAVLRVCEDPEVKENGMMMVLLMAAAYDMIENEKAKDFRNIPQF